ncbi:MAG TPA: DUF1592 domain-containing protein [Polyangia bacterium]|nr:DUF1592 domain-containing protein [Polyangia bacterium]
MLLAIGCLACTGRISEDAVSDPTSGTKPPGNGTMTGGKGGTVTPPPMGPNAPGAAPLRRLTVREYNNTLRDLLGIAPASRDLGVDQDAGGFAVGGPVTTSGDAARLLDAAEQLAAGAAAKIGTLVPCAPVPADAAAQGDCAKKFINQFGRRAFRRPLAPEEAADLFAVYSAHRGGDINQPFDQAIRSVVAAMLSSPFFLYRAEGANLPPVKEQGLVRFNPHELASRLSYTLWGSMPDDALFAEVDAGRLTTPEQIEAQARRMLKDPKIADAIADFHLQWLYVDGLPKEPPKDPKFTAYTPQLVEAMLKETAAFANEVFAGDGKLERLLTGTPSAIDPALAKLYGAPDPTQRAGVLTQASFLAMHANAADTNPVRRGAVVLRRLLCNDVQPPVNMDVGQPKPPAPGLTTRERFAEHAENPCATCHRLTDPIGFAFENYDAIGAWRTTEQGKAIDASGTLALSGSDLKFKNAVELARGLAGAKDVRECLATQWLRYFTRRNESAGDTASLEAANAAFASSGYDMRELLVALTKTRAFTHRSPSVGEVLP